MKVSNNIHNVANLEDVEFVEEWTEQEKIPIKASPITVPVPEKPVEKVEKSKKEEKRDAKKAAEEEKKPEEEKKADEEQKPEEVKQPEQQYEIKERKKKTFKSIKFSTSNFALAPKQRKEYTEVEAKLFDGD